MTSRTCYFALQVFVSLLCLGQAQDSEKINVSVYYESLCPDSVRFIQEQLAPNWPLISPYVNIHLIPFGKSKSANNGKQFICQHGPHECAGNKLQSCALNELNDQNQQVAFVACMMSFYGNAQACISEVGLTVETIEQCYRSDVGIKLQLEAEKFTKSVAPTFVPTIVYENKFDQSLQEASLDNFKSVICSLITAKFPQQTACHQSQTTLLL